MGESFDFEMVFYIFFFSFSFEIGQWEIHDNLCGKRVIKKPNSLNMFRSLDIE